MIGGAREKSARSRDKDEYEMTIQRNKHLPGVMFKDKLANCVKRWIVDCRGDRALLLCLSFYGPYGITPTGPARTKNPHRKLQDDAFIEGSRKTPWELFP